VLGVVENMSAFVPPDAPDLSWLQGQTGRTLVYRQRLVLPSGR
jgi:hypothetical protein